MCSWISTKDRNGNFRYVGLNYLGLPLVDAGPSPTGSGHAITTRRFNADGELVLETRADGSRS